MTKTKTKGKATTKRQMTFDERKPMASTWAESFDGSAYNGDIIKYRMVLFWKMGGDRIRGDIEEYANARKLIRCWRACFYFVSITGVYLFWYFWHYIFRLQIS